MIRIVAFIQIAILLLICGCVEPFSPDLPQNSSSLLVVEGSITNAEGPYKVNLSRSFAVSSGETSPVSGAEMTIEEEDGSDAPLTETSDGTYVSNGIQGKAGHRYRLSFKLDGDQYVSSWIELRLSPPIDSVYWRLEEKETSDPEVTISGIQFFLDTHGSEEDVRFYRWILEESWEFGVNHETYFEYLGNDLTAPLDELRNLCWMDAFPRTIDALTNSNLAGNVVSEHPLLFVTNESERLTRRYSLLVRQYALEEEEYFFWRNLGESNEELGNLFDKQPAKVIGNIQNLSNPDEFVLGYFWASGVSEKRVFVHNRELTPELTRLPLCVPDTVMKSQTSDNLIFEKLDAGQVFYVVLHSPFGGGVAGYLLTNPGCSDCVFKGGNPDKPEYWDD